MSLALAAALLAGASALLALAPPTARPMPGPVQMEPGRAAHRPRGRQGLMSALAGVAALLFVGGPGGPVAGVLVSVLCWRMLGRVEPPAVRRAREQTARDLPHLVGLMAAGLRAGAPPSTALAAACAALPGEAALAFASTRARLDLGVDPVTVFADLATAEAPGVATLGRTLARAHLTGASVRQTVEALADQLAQQARASVEDRARAVGVKAALPLGLCLLPAFLLLGIVPVVAGLGAQLAGGASP